jgi:hypothetical protein
MATAKNLLVCLLLLAACALPKSVLAQIYISGSGPSVYTPCPGISANIVTLTITNTEATPVPAPFYIQLDLGVDLVGAAILHGPFLEHTDASVSSTLNSAWEEAYQGTHTALKILSPLTAGVHTISFQVQPKCAFSFVNGNTQDQGADNEFINVYKVFNGSNTLLASSTSVPFTLNGPRLIFPVLPANMMIPFNSTEIYREIALKGTDGIQPVSGVVLVEDVHALTGGGVDPATVTGIRYFYNNNWIVIPREPAPSSAPGRDRFRIDQASSNPGVQALYQAIFTGSGAIVQEVINVAGFCQAEATSEGMRSAIHLGWACGNEPDAMFCNESVRNNIMLTRDTGVPCLGIVSTTTTTALPACYYSGTGYGVTTLRIRNTGTQPGSIRRFVIAFAGTTTGQMAANTEAASHLVVSPDAPVEFTQPFAYSGGSPDWSSNLLTISGISSGPVGTITYSPKNCGEQGEAFIMYNDNSVFFNDLAPGQAIEFRYRFAVCDPNEGIAQLECDNAFDYAITPLSVGVAVDHACYRLTSQQVRAGLFVPGSCPSYTYTYNPRLQLSRTQYIGNTFNLIGACFLTPDADFDPQEDPQMNWDVRFKLQDKVSLWPLPTGVPASNEKLALEVLMEPYLFLNAADLLGDHPLTITTTAGEVFSTAANTPAALRLSILDPTPGNGSVNFCTDLDCPSTYQGADGWSELQRVVLLVDAFNGASTNWVTTCAGCRLRDMAKFENAVIKVPLRMHCPDEAGDVNDAKCLAYVPGCTFAADPSTAPAAAPKDLRIRLLQIPDMNAPCNSSGQCSVPVLPLSCLTQTFNIQCPGCTRLGIHSESFAFNRYSYGLADVNDDGFADADLHQITYEEVMAGQHPQVNQHRAMYGDIVKGELETTIKMNCNGYGPCVDGLPAVNLTHLYYQTMMGMVAGALCPQNQITDLVDLKMTFTNPDNSIAFTVTMDGVLDTDNDGTPDILDPDQNGAGFVFARTGGKTVFDLSPTSLTGRPFVQISTPALYGPGFTFNAHHNMRIRVETRFKIVCNIGPTSEPVSVNNQIFLTAHTHAGPLANVENEFPDPSVTFITFDCSAPGVNCDDYQYYCTKKGAGFELTGYVFNVNTNAASFRGTCAYGPAYTYRFSIGAPLNGWGGGTPTNAFPNEFRNWMRLSGASGWFDAISPAGWANGRLGLAENTRGGIRPGHLAGDRRLTLANGQGITYAPQLSIGGTPRAQVISNLSQPLNYTNGTVADTATNKLFLPDDGYSLQVEFIYEANCNTPSGPAQLTYFNPNHYDYAHGRDVQFGWGASGPLPGVIGNTPGLSLSYHRPVLSLASNLNINSPTTCWDNIVLGHNTTDATNPAHSTFSANSLWVGIDENPGAPLLDGMDVESIYYKHNSNAYAPLSLNVQSGVKYPIPVAVISSDQVRIKVCATVPCIVPLNQDHNQGSAPGDAPEGDAEVDLYTGWSCGAPSGPLTSDCSAKEILRYVPNTPQLQVPSVTVVPVSCDRYRLTMEVKSTGTGPVTGLEVGANVAMSAGAGWTYVPGTAQLLDNTQLLLGTAGVNLAEPIASSTGCVTGTDQMYWSLTPASCISCSPALQTLLTDGLCPTGNPCAKAYVTFEITRDSPNCAAMTAPVQVWARSSACGVLCQVQSTVIATTVAPAVDIVASLSSPTITDCAVGSAVDLVITPSGQTISDVAVTLQLPSGLGVASSPATGCATSVDVTGSTVVWHFTGPMPLVPCTLSVQLAPVSCVQATYPITASATTACCNLPLGGATGTVSVEVSGENCDLNISTDPTPSLCNGPWANSHVLCGVGGNVPIQFNGNNYFFRDVAGAFVQYNSGQVWTLTGEIENIQTTSDRYWVQLYFEAPTALNAWGGAILGTPPVGADWSIYHVSSNPSWPSQFVGAGSNVGAVYTISAGNNGTPGPSGEYGFQTGFGACPSHPNENAVGFSFLAAGNNGGAAIAGQICGTLFCDFDWSHYFSACNGSLILNWVATVGNTYSITLYHSDGTVADVVSASYPQSAVTIGGLCNDTYHATVTWGSGCSTSVTGIVLENGIEPLSGIVDFPNTACTTYDACVAAINVTGGTSPYHVEWWWQSIYPGGTPAITAPDELHCHLPLNEESWGKIIDANGCHVTYKYYISEQARPLYNVTSTNACGANGGSISLDLFFNTDQPHTLDWSGPDGFSATGPQLTGLAPGDYVLNAWSFDLGCAEEQTISIINDCPCEIPLEMVLQTDANAAETSWEILDQANSTVVCSGSGYPNSTVITDNTCCLNDGCYRLRVLDASGNGMSMGNAGGYILRIQDGQNRLIDDRNNFSTGAVSAISGNQGFCLPISTMAPLFSSQDKLDWVNGQFLVITADPAVSAAWVPGGTNAQQSATTGYEVWFYDPNGTYSYKRFRNHSTSDGYGTGATRACHLRVNGANGWATANHIPPYTLMNIRVRTRINGVNGEWGPAFRFKIDPERAACPLTHLIDDPAQQYYSCGVVRTLGNGSGSRVYAQPVPGANKYQFRFRLPGTSFEVIRTLTTYICQLNWTGPTALQPGNTYDVQVRVSKDNGVTWCISDDNWGDICTVTIPGAGMAQGSNSGSIVTQETGLQLWPNPNSDHRVNFRLNGLDIADLGEVEWKMYDVLGRVAVSTRIQLEDGSLQGNVDLPSSISPGPYLVKIFVGDQEFVGSLVVH